MPISGIIPQAKSGLDIFNDLMQRNQENQYRQALSQQAQANAQRAQVISKLLGQAFSSGSSGQGSAAGGAQPNNGMDMLYRLGILKPTPGELANINSTTKAKEQLQKETQESAYSQLPLNASFSAMDKILKDPEYRENAAGAKSTLLNAKPFGLPLGSMLQKNLPNQFPSSMVKKLASAQVHMGNIVVGVGQKFKGPMKQLTANYIDNMKPTPTDSPDVQQAKITQLKLMSDLADRQNERIDELSRQGMDPTQAIIQSTKELMPEYQKMVSSSIGQESGQEQNQQPNQMVGQQAEQPAQNPMNYGAKAPQSSYMSPEIGENGSDNDKMANAPAQPQQAVKGNPDDMVYLVVDKGNGKKTKVKVKRVFAEAIKAGKLKYAG